MEGKNFSSEKDEFFLTLHEYTRIIGDRALQLHKGAMPLIPLSEIPPTASPEDVARLEFKRGVLPLSIRRTFPDGSYIEIPVKKIKLKQRI
ncbi:MAG: hypothetical protein QXL15_02250 [Candidatus Korarchaeota archaeon]